MTSPGLTPATVTITAKAAKLRPAVPLWRREVPAGAGITGLWRPVPPAVPAGGGGFGMGGGADSLFTLKQDGSKLTGTVEGAGRRLRWRGGDQPVPVEDGKVDGSTVSFRAGTTTYSGTVERGELQLQRTFAGGRGGGFGPGGAPTPPAGAIVPLGQSAQRAPGGRPAARRLRSFERSVRKRRRPPRDSKPDRWSSAKPPGSAFAQCNVASPADWCAANPSVRGAPYSA